MSKQVSVNVGSLAAFATFSALAALWWWRYSSKKSENRPKRQRRVIEFSPHTEGTKFHKKPPVPSSHFEDVAKQMTLELDGCKVQPERECIKGIHPEAAFLVKNVLSQEECALVMKAARETGFEQRRFQGDGTDSSSCVTWCPQLADAVYERLKDHVVKQSYFDSSGGISLDELDFENQIVTYKGTTNCINPNIRVEKYHSSQHLKIHRDGCVLVKGRDNVFTIYAVLIYLNDGFSKGETKFVKSKILKGGELFSYIDIKGDVGDALIFRHEILHAGGTVEDGSKQVLRMDVAYKLS